MKFRQGSRSMKHSTNEKVEARVSLYAVVDYILQWSIDHSHLLLFLCG